MQWIQGVRIQEKMPGVTCRQKCRFTWHQKEEGSPHTSPLDPIGLNLYMPSKVQSGGSTSPSDLTLLIIRLDVSCRGFFATFMREAPNLRWSHEIYGQSGLYGQSQFLFKRRQTPNCSFLLFAGSHSGFLQGALDGSNGRESKFRKVCISCVHSWLFRIFIHVW